MRKSLLGIINSTFQKIYKIPVLGSLVRFLVDFILAIYYKLMIIFN